jgi:flagellar hook assembly protein FlgD
VAGQEVRTINWQQGLTTDGRNAFEIVWDGTDDDGDVVPYGIYVARVEVRFKVEPRNERKNIPIVLIK